MYFVQLHIAPKTPKPLRADYLILITKINSHGSAHHEELLFKAECPVK